jgi:hypothetical protein
VTKSHMKIQFTVYRVNQGARLTIHINCQFSMLDCAREGGRAGCNEKCGETIMIIQEGDQQVAKDKQGEAEQVLMQSHVEGAGGCRRAVLEGHLDRY